MFNAIYNILSNNTDLNNLVSGRIYPMFLPETSALPAIIMEQVSNSPGYCKSGKYEEDYRISLIIYSERKTAQHWADIEAIADITKDIMDNVAGAYAGYTITQVRHLNDFQNYEQGADVLQHTIDFSVKIQPK